MFKLIDKLFQFHKSLAPCIYSASRCSKILRLINFSKSFIFVKGFLVKLRIFWLSFIKACPSFIQLTYSQSISKLLSLLLLLNVSSRHNVRIFFYLHSLKIILFKIISLLFPFLELPIT